MTSKMTHNKNLFWTFPLLAGILTIIGLITPFSMRDGVCYWLWGGYYIEIGGDIDFYWIFQLEFQKILIIFISNFILLFVLLISAIGSIYYSFKMRKEASFQRFERKWSFLGFTFIIAAMIYLVSRITIIQLFEYRMLTQYFNQEGLAVSSDDFFIPSFGTIAPFLSGGIILIGFVVNKHVLPKRPHWYLKIKHLYRNIIYSFIIGISIFFIGSIIVFSIFHLLPGDPVLVYLISHGVHSPSPALIAATKKQLGLDQPLILQYFKFLWDFFTGNWGDSVSLARGVEVLTLLKRRAPFTIDLLILPLIFGMGAHVILGIWLGKTSYKLRSKWSGNVIQILSGFGIAIPIFFLGMLFQYYFCIYGPFPATGYKKPGFTDPKYKTGFYIIDAILAGELGKIYDYLLHLAIPLFILTITSIALISWQTHSFLRNKTHKKSIISNTVMMGTIFGFIFMFIIIIETTFSLYGMGRLFIDAINQTDYWLITGVLTSIVVLFVIICVISNIIFSFYKFRVETSSIKTSKKEMISN